MSRTSSRATIINSKRDSIYDSSISNFSDQSNRDSLLNSNSSLFGRGSKQIAEEEIDEAEYDYADASSLDQN